MGALRLEPNLKLNHAERQEESTSEVNPSDPQSELSCPVAGLPFPHALSSLSRARHSEPGFLLTPTLP